jgi:Icc-related predicted phosphoesterase
MRILACAHLNGALDRLAELRRAVDVERPDVLVFAGSLQAPGHHDGGDEVEARTLHRALHELAAMPCEVAVVPGEWDAPERRVVSIMAGQEWAEHHLACIHGMHVARGELALAGFGGRITEREREVESALRYPGWEARYRLAFLTQLDQPLLVLVFHTPPARVRELDVVDGQPAGSEAVTELIGTWSPKVAVVAGDRPGQQLYAATVVVSPGRLDRGEYAVFDARQGRDVRFLTTAAAKAGS